MPLKDGMRPLSWGIVDERSPPEYPPPPPIAADAAAAAAEGRAANCRRESRKLPRVCTAAVVPFAGDVGSQRAWKPLLLPMKRCRP